MKAISLFSIVGIGEFYLHRLGIEVIVANELLPERAKFYQHTHPQTWNVEQAFTLPIGTRLKSNGCPNCGWSKCN